MIDGYLIRYFIAVVEAGSFTAAALRVNVTQPTLSAGIAKLERELGTKLFLRSARRTELTAGGSRFLVRARNIQQEYNLALSEFGEGGRARALRLGVLHTIPVAQIAAIAGEWLRIDAANGIEIVEGADHELVTRLESGRIDLALTLVRGGETFAPMIVATEAYVLALAPGHKLSGEAVIEPDALGADPMVIRRRCEVLGAVSRHFTSRGIRPPLAYRTFHDERAMALVASGLGVTVMPESYANPAIATARLGGFDQVRTLGVLTSPLSMARTRDAANMRAIIAASYARSQ